MTVQTTQEYSAQSNKSNPCNKRCISLQQLPVKMKTSNPIPRAEDLYCRQTHRISSSLPLSCIINNGINFPTLTSIPVNHNYLFYQINNIKIKTIGHRPP